MLTNFSEGGSSEAGVISPVLYPLPSLYSNTFNYIQNGTGMRLL